jgi:plasmid stabilization system protein ParE
MRLVLRLKAKQDLREAYLWYEERQPGLGRAFYSAFDATLAILREHPQIFPRVDPSTRRASMKSFPYGIFFRITEDTIRIIAVVHNARNPEHWRRRR